MKKLKSLAQKCVDLEKYWYILSLHQISIDRNNILSNL